VFKLGLLGARHGAAKYSHQLSHSDTQECGQANVEYALLGLSGPTLHNRELTEVGTYFLHTRRSRGVWLGHDTHDNGDGRCFGVSQRTLLEDLKLDEKLAVVKNGVFGPRLLFSWLIEFFPLFCKKLLPVSEVDLRLFSFRNSDPFSYDLNKASRSH
jgi:hypothetical protein